MTEPQNLYYDLRGQPLTHAEYKKNLKHDRDIAHKTMWFGHVHVDTIWTGFDQSYAYNSKPQIFETTVRVGDSLEVMERYATIDEALSGHKYWSAYYRSPAVVLKSLVPSLE